MVSEYEKSIVAQDGTRVVYYTREISGADWWVLWPALSANHTSLERIAQGLNERGISTLVPDPSPTGKSGMASFEHSAASDLAMMIQQESITHPTFFAVSAGLHPVVHYLHETGNGKALYACSSSQDFQATAISPGFYWLYERLRNSVWLGHGIMRVKHLLMMEDMSNGNLSDVNGDAKLWLRLTDIEPEKLRATIVLGASAIHSNVAEELSQLELPVFEIHGRYDWLVFWQSKGISTVCKHYSGMGVVSGTHMVATTKPQVVLAAIDRLRKTYKQPAGTLENAHS